MATLLSHASKPLLQMLLFVLFLGFFGLPSIRRYQMMKVMVVSSSHDTGGIAAPDITIVALNPGTMSGWKGDSESGHIDMLEKRCKDDNIVNCIKSETFNSSDFFKDIIIGWVTRESLLARESLLLEDFGIPLYGRYYTFNTGRMMEPEDDHSQVFLTLSNNFVYEIFLHDPDFFMINESPIGLGSIKLTLNPNMTGKVYYRISLTEVEELNLADDPCNPDSEYNFKACINEYLSNEVRFPPDMTTHNRTS